MQNRTHTCDELRLSDAGKRVQLSGWMDSVRIVSANLAFVILRDFYGTTQVVIDDEEQMKIIRSLNKESVISVTGISAGSRANQTWARVSCDCNAPVQLRLCASAGRGNSMVFLRVAKKAPDLNAASFDDAHSI